MSRLRVGVLPPVPSEVHRSHIADNPFGNGRAYRKPKISELIKAQLQRGDLWEALLFQWLDTRGLLLHVQGCVLNGSDIQEVIEMDDRDHFFVAGLTFWPPANAFQAKFLENGHDPVHFSIAKPDLVEIRRDSKGMTLWQVVDAKSCLKVKTSHHVQIYFYHVCLENLLTSSRFQPMGTCAIWLPPSFQQQHDPSLDGIKPIATSLLSLPLNKFLFDELPTILCQPRTTVKWHLNPLCQGCSFESECTLNSVHTKALGMMPNISIQDANVLLDVLNISRNHRQADKLTDIEDLQATIQSRDDISYLEQNHPTIVKRVKRILNMRKLDVHNYSSPVIDAALTKQTQTTNNRDYTLPSNEDIAVVISIVLDPATNQPCAYCISTISTLANFVCPGPLSGSTDDFIAALASIIQYILDANEVQSTPPTTQFYMFSPIERQALQRFLINESLTSDSLDVDTQLSIRNCIGALCEGASLLASSFQPVILSGALLDFIAKKGRLTTYELQLCAERLGLSTIGCNNEEMRQQIEDELDRLKAQSKGKAISRSKNHQDVSDTRPEIGCLPRIVVLRQTIHRLLALPIPGYWDLPNCHAVLTTGSSSPTCPSDERIYEAYASGEKEVLKILLQTRNNCIFGVLKEIRHQLSRDRPMEDILVNNARVLTADFMDICQQDHLRKLFFMQQFEILAKLTALWKDRIDGCIEAIRLDYRFTNRIPNGTYLHYFSLSSGYVELPADKDHSYYGYILTEDIEMDIDIPIEALFDDLAVYNAMFPLNRFTKAKWTKQPRVIQERLLVADVTDITIRNDITLVVIRTYGSPNLQLKKNARYRLSPRLVDFNVEKMLSTLVELDIQTPAHPGYMLMPPFLQLITDPRGFAKLQADDTMTEYFLKAEDAIHRTFRELINLGNDVASALQLKPSQRHALRRILQHRLAVIWGPPGTGKTYTIALSLLRLIEVKSRYDDKKRMIIFITAMTHAAVAACIAKLEVSIRNYGQISGLDSGWLNTLHLEHVTSGATHTLPKPRMTYIYAGTVYQLYSFGKRISSKVDCCVIDEAGQLGLCQASLVLKSLRSDGRVIIAGDSEQLAPILTTQYPQSEYRLFDSTLECLMHLLSSDEHEANEIRTGTGTISFSDLSQTNTIVQLTENFRLNPDLGDFVSTIYKKSFKPQKSQTRSTALQLASLAEVECKEKVDNTAREILVALSSAMLRKHQSLLTRPNINSANEIDAIVDMRPISLVMIRLSTMFNSPDQVGYEAHVRAEASLAAALVRLLQQASPEETIFVATPHRVQRHAVKEALRTRVDDLADAFGTLRLQEDRGPTSSHGKVVVDTIERLQGSEASFVLCLFSYTYAANASSAIDFLLERRRLNVAISRAKTLCILVTSHEVLKPSVRIFANAQSAKGFAFLRAFEDRAWSTDVKLQVDEIAHQVPNI